MSEATRNIRAIFGWGFPVVVMASFTVLLFCIEYSLAGMDEHSVTGTFFTHFLRLPPNEMGDAQAGVFGSLAFLAAAIAVFWQGRELKMQREELALTREEMKKQSEAASTMVKLQVGQEAKQKFYFLLEQLFDAFFTLDAEISDRLPRLERYLLENWRLIAAKDALTEILDNKIYWKNGEAAQ